MTSGNNNTVDFTQRKTSQQKEEEELNRLWQEGLQHTKESLDNSTGFLVITFDEDENPEIAWGGNIDAHRVLGVLEFTKTSITQSLIEDAAMDEEF